MSRNINTWPKVPLPGPMPMAGQADNRAAMSAASAAGTISSIISDAPASCSALASRTSSSLRPPDHEKYRAGANDAGGPDAQVGVGERQARADFL